MFHLLVWEWFRLAIYDLCDGNGMLIRPVWEIHENAAGFSRDADSGHLLVRKTGDLLQVRSRNGCCVDNKSGENQMIKMHEKSSSLSRELDDQKDGAGNMAALHHENLRESVESVDHF